MANYTNNIPNSKVNSCYWDGESWQIKIATNDGYMFDGDVYAEYDDILGDYVQLKMTVNNAKSLASAYPDTNVNGTEIFTFTGATKAAELNITNNVANTTVSSTKSGYSGTITLKANDGYKIDNAQVAFYDGYGDPVTENLQVSADGLTATWQNDDCDTSGNFIITGTTSATTVEPTITNNIANSTASYTGSSHQYVITIKADDGYLFSGDVEASYTGYSSDKPVSVTFVVSSDKKTASGVCPDVDENTPVVLTGATVVDVVITVVNNITGTTETHTFDGTDFAVNVKGTSYKIRFKNAQMTYTDTNGNEQTTDLVTSIVDTIPQATGTAQVKNGTTVTLTGTYENVTLVKTSLSNCTVTETLPDALFADDVLNVTVNANTGTSFQTVPIFEYEDELGELQYKDLTLSTNKKQATGTFTNPDYIPQVVTLYASATPDKIIGTNYGAIHVYKVTLDNLEAFSKKRFFKEAINSDGTEFTLINLGDYVNRIKRLFLTVPTASTDVIKCGNYNTGVECEAPDTDTVTLNFGSITVPSPNGDVTDYQSELQLFVPFKGFVTLPVDYVGKTITLTYTINVITSGGVAKVLCGDDVILLLDVDPNEDILYQTNLNNLATIGGDAWNEQYLYGVEPFLYVKYYNSLNKTARNNDYENAKLGDLSGFCVVDGVTLTTTAEMTADEQETIISLLKNGVYIER